MKRLEENERKFNNQTELIQRINDFCENFS